MADNDEITLGDAHVLWLKEQRSKREQPADAEQIDEATAALEAMLAAGRRGKTVRG